MKKIIGWTYGYLSNLPKVEYTKERRNAMVEIVRKRQYNFTHFDHEYMGCAPVYEDGVICILTKDQFDEVIDTVYEDISMCDRLSPYDVVGDNKINDILYENKEVTLNG